MRRNLYLLTTPGFLVGLSLLLANDFLFKPLFNNWLTGKLSDFAGLFIFPLFWTVCAPRHKRAVFLLTGIGFLFWKSGLSQPLIDEWNYLTPLTLARERDATDLLALFMLVPAYRYHSSFAGLEPHAAASFNRRWATCLVAVVSLFAFTATSYRTNYDYSGEEFVFADTKAGLTKRLEKLPHKLYEGNPWKSSSSPDEYSLTIKADICFGSIRALIEIKEQNERQSRLILRMLEHRCPSEEGDKEKMLLIFNREIVGKLQDDIDANPSAAPSPAPGAKPAAGAAFIK